jgi:hypothetical protein
MKFVLGALAMLVLAAGIAYADEESSATSHVFVVVSPNIALQTEDYFDLGDVQTGCFFGEIPFRVDANTEAVTFFAEVSYLYKGNDPTNDDVAPILVNLEEYPELVFANANPTGGGDPCLMYLGNTSFEGFLGYYTENVTYESSQSGHFSQDGFLTVYWTQDDDEKPMGEYSGLVVLHGMVAI